MGEIRGGDSVKKEIAHIVGVRKEIAQGLQQELTIARSCASEDQTLRLSISQTRS